MMDGRDPRTLAAPEWSGSRARSREWLKPNGPSCCGTSTAPCCTSARSPAAGPKALAAIRSARAEVRSRVWKLAGADGPAAGGQVTVDIDGVLVLARP